MAQPRADNEPPGQGLRRPSGGETVDRQRGLGKQGGPGAGIVACRNLDRRGAKRPPRPAGVRLPAQAQAARQVDRLLPPLGQARPGGHRRRPRLARCRPPLRRPRGTRRGDPLPAWPSAGGQRSAKLDPDARRQRAARGHRLGQGGVRLDRQLAGSARPDPGTGGRDRRTPRPDGTCHRGGGALAEGGIHRPRLG